MPVAAVRIPQLGEGIQEALVIEFFKQTGDSVKRDEPLYAMETDKGTIDVESPYEGKLVQWLVEAGTVQSIGAAIAEMEVAEGVEEMAVVHGPQTTSAPATPSTTAPATPAGGTARNRSIPPRTRRYLREHGLQDEVHLIPAAARKLTPEDVDAYLATKSIDATTAIGTPPSESASYSDKPLSKAQLRLNYRLVRGIQICVPVVVSMDVDVSGIVSAHTQLKEQNGDDTPSEFVLFLWCIARAMQKHAGFRSTLVDEGRTLRTFDHVNLGIAVSLPDDLLVTAVVNEADQMNWHEFVSAVKRQVELARAGADQATAATTVSVSNMGSVGVRSAIAAVVPPAMGTITLGRVFDAPLPDGDGFKFVRAATTTLTFDHRIVNGVAAARFFDEVKKEVEGFTLPQ